MRTSPLAKRDPAGSRTDRAERDLIEIGSFIARDNPAAAARILADLQAKSLLLGAFPRLGRPDPERPGRRIHSTGKYVIIYSETRDGILVLRYLHGRRDRRSL